MGNRVYLKNGIEWVIKEGVFWDLKDVLDAVDMENYGERVRAGGYKRILKYSKGGEIFYIKQYTVKNILESVKSIICSSRAQREWDQGNRLLESEVPTAEPVAFGEKRIFGVLKECCLITRALPEVTTVKGVLKAFQKNEIAQLEKVSFLKDLMVFVKKVHDRGIFHGELHGENILVHTGGRPLFYLIDLGRTEYKRKPPLSLRIYELSRLLYSVMDTCSHEEIRELMSVYTDRFSAIKDRERFCKQIFYEMDRIKLRLWRSRMGKCLKNNNVFCTAQYNGYAVNMRRGWDLHGLLELIRGHTKALNEGVFRVIKKSAKTGITCVPVTGKDVKSVCIKEYNYQAAFKKFFYFLWGSPARLAWSAAHGLMALNISTPEPIALFEKKGFASLVRSFIIMQDISSGLPCNEYIQKKFPDISDRTVLKQKRRFIACLAQSFRLLHGSGVYHGDLKANNIMIKELNDTWDFLYLDLDRVYFRRRITQRKIIKNLSQFNASIPCHFSYTDRLRFYRIYSGKERLTEDCKYTLRRVVQISIRRNHLWTPKGIVSSRARQ